MLDVLRRALALRRLNITSIVTTRIQIYVFEVHLKLEEYNIRYEYQVFEFVEITPTPWIALITNREAISNILIA